jgi:hypothetical protein
MAHGFVEKDKLLISDHIPFMLSCMTNVKVDPEGSQTCEYQFRT